MCTCVVLATTTSSTAIGTGAGTGPGLGAAAARKPGRDAEPEKGLRRIAEVGDFAGSDGQDDLEHERVESDPGVFEAAGVELAQRDLNSL